MGLLDRYYAPADYVHSCKLMNLRIYYQHSCIFLWRGDKNAGDIKSLDNFDLLWAEPFLVAQQRVEYARIYGKRYWMNYWVAGFVANIGFGSSPIPLPPFTRQQVVSHSQSSCVLPDKRTDVGGGGARSQITRRRESLVLHKVFSTFWYIVQLWFRHRHKYI